eukprot:COSAG02_NODE_3563_length_6554_cov_7.849419_5_plen_163_part_00
MRHVQLHRNTAFRPRIDSHGQFQPPARTLSSHSASYRAYPGRTFRGSAGVKGRLQRAAREYSCVSSLRWTYAAVRGCALACAGLDLPAAIGTTTRSRSRAGTSTTAGRLRYDSSPSSQSVESGNQPTIETGAPATGQVKEKVLPRPEAVLNLTPVLEYVFEY